MENTPKLILASASPRRKELLEQMGLCFEVQASEIDEKTIEHLTPEELVQALAQQKARAVAERTIEPSIIVIGADTLVVIENQILGKPKDEEEAKQMLTLLQGRTHQVYTGIALLHVISGKASKELVRASQTNVTMRVLSSQKLDWYIHTKEPMDKAGSYGIQGLGSTLVQRIDGCYSNVVGLSIPLLDQMLSEIGYTEKTLH